MITMLEIFYAMIGNDADPAVSAHAFVVALLCIAASQIVGAGTGLSIVDQGSRVPVRPSSSRK